MELAETKMYQEIYDQPEVLRRFLAGQRASVRELAARMRARDVTHVVIAARGTSDNAGRYAKYVLGANNGLLAMLAAPSLFSVYHSPPRLGNALVLGISQSGRSPDIVSVLAEARRQGALTAAITNTPDSDLAGQSDVVIDLMAGEEQAVAATKSYSAELAAVALLSATLAGDEAMFAALEQIPAAVEATLALNEEVAACAERYHTMRYAAVIGRGFNYATAFETALKMKELSYAIVEPYSSADFLHGPLALLEPGFPVVVIAPAGKVQAEMGRFMETLDGRGAESIVVSDRPELLARGHVPLALPVSTPEWLSPLTAVVPGQLLALHLAQERGYDVDRPRAISKVTETH